MGARVNAKGVTKFKFGQTVPGTGVTADSSSNAEAVAIRAKGGTVNQSLSPNGVGRKIGTPVKGATRTKGGKI